MAEQNGRYDGLKIGFTGHRDRLVERIWLDWIHTTWPGATWVHGGAIGFDTQVNDYAIEHGIPRQVKRPEYKETRTGATFIRNREIVQETAFLCACYDGRLKGGAFYTVNYARKIGKPVILLVLTTEVIEQLALPLF
jgi:hypothetical protein